MMNQHDREEFKKSIKKKQIKLSYGMILHQLSKVHAKRPFHKVYQQFLFLLPTSHIKASLGSPCCSRWSLRKKSWSWFCWWSCSPALWNVKMIMQNRPLLYSCKWSYGAPYKWPKMYKWVNGIISPPRSGVITLPQKLNWCLGDDPWPF